jgi:hypothetical protein
MVYEVSLHDDLWAKSDQEAEAQPTHLRPLSLLRSQMLWNSMQCCKALIQSFLAYSAQQVSSLTAFTYSRLCYAFITLARIGNMDLGTLSENCSGQIMPCGSVSQHHTQPALSLAEGLDFTHLASKVQARFTALATDFVDSQGERDTMAKLSNTMGMMITGFDRQMRDKRKQLVVNDGLDEVADNSFAEFNTETSNGGLNDGFGQDFQWEGLDDVMWDQVLESFALIP